jgi:hypothetical protein
MAFKCAGYASTDELFCKSALLKPFIVRIISIPCYWREDESRLLFAALDIFLGVGNTPHPFILFLVLIHINSPSCRWRLRALRMTAATPQFPICVRIATCSALHDACWAITVPTVFCPCRVQLLPVFLCIRGESYSDEVNAAMCIPRKRNSQNTFARQKLFNNPCE